MIFIYTHVDFANIEPVVVVVVDRNTFANSRKYYVKDIEMKDTVVVVVVGYTVKDMEMDMDKVVDIVVGVL